MESSFVPQLVTSAILIVVMVHVILGGCAYAILAERKISAWIQDRVGPNRVGPKGLLQPIADGLKFFLKEDYTPRNVEKLLFTLAPAFAVIPALIAFAAIPWGGTLELSSLPFGLAEWLGVEDQTVQIVGANINVGVIYMLAVGAMGVYGIALGGWASNNKYTFLGGMRASAQMISYEIPMGVAILAVILLSGTLDLTTIVTTQRESGWFILQLPVAAVLYYICRLAECNRAPFDLAEAEQELVGGYHTEYSSMRFALFFLGEYAHMITGAALFAVLFLGGWSLNPLPFGPDLPTEGGLLLILLQVAVVLAKAGLIVCFDMVVRWSVPRFRFDQLMRLSWEGLIPISLVVLLATSIMVFMGWHQYTWVASLATIAIVYAISPILGRESNPNPRIPMIGSRFSPMSDHERPVAASEQLAFAESVGDDR
ncbi:MAG: NADH-quinone oxidoreductase subunit NuoH [Phycisphaerales bacterium]|nr:NADH-quinone oxidoreductase subunit NuoH [Phycisphaerales bacterium]